jgi:hypothetical protein
MEWLIWIGWIICGIIGVFLYSKVYKSKEKYNITQYLIFIWGYFGLFFILMLILSERTMSKNVKN